MLFNGIDFLAQMAATQAAADTGADDGPKGGKLKLLSIGAIQLLVCMMQLGRHGHAGTANTRSAAEHIGAVGDGCGGRGRGHLAVVWFFQTSSQGFRVTAFPTVCR